MNTQVRKSAIVTGASRGIGQAIAQRLAADGFAVVVNYASSEAAARETVEAIRAAGGTALAVRADAGSVDDVRELFAIARREFGRVDLVVANGGVMRTAPIASMSPDDFDGMIAINLRGTFLAMAEAAKHLERGGRFVALSSSVIAKHTPGYGPYIASKAGVEGLVQVFAQEMHGRDISVNAVAPGPVATELFLKGKSDELISQIVKQAPLERIGQPQDIADAVSFLAGPGGGWVNGQVLRVNGGFA
jgi:3-oxoacyl-[acyl-carrier protein] reductase